MTLPRRVPVEKISAPHAEIRTAGVIIAVSTASALAGASRRDSQSIGLNSKAKCGVRSPKSGVRESGVRESGMRGGSDASALQIPHLSRTSDFALRTSDTMSLMRAIIVREFGGP